MLHRLALLAVMAEMNERFITEILELGTLEPTVWSRCPIAASHQGILLLQNNQQAKMSKINTELLESCVTKVGTSSKNEAQYE